MVDVTKAMESDYLTVDTVKELKQMEAVIIYEELLKEQEEIEELFSILGERK
jgi:hypothetical protein